MYVVWGPFCLEKLLNHTDLFRNPWFSIVGQYIFLGRNILDNLRDSPGLPFRGMIEQDPKYLWFPLSLQYELWHMIQDPVSILESVIDVSSSHENIEQTSRKDVLQLEANAEGR